MPVGGEVGGGLGQAVLDLVTDKTKFSAGLRAAEAETNAWLTRTSAGMKQTGAAIAGVGASMTASLTLPIAAAGAAISHFALDFDTALRRVVGLTDVTQEEIGGIREELLALSTEIGKTPQELAEAFYFVASAGFKAGEAMEVLDVAARASAAGLGETQTIAQVLGAALNAYGKENLAASRAADILTEAVSQGTAEASEFAGSLGRIIPIAAEMEVPFEQVAGALAAMTLSGVSADEAVTALRQILVSTLNPTTEAADALREVGLTAEGLRRQIREEGLIAALRTLEERFAGNEEATAQVFGNVRALVGVQNLLGLSAEQLDGVMDSVANSVGRLGEAYEETEGPQREVDREMASLQETAIELGADVLPVVVDVLEGVAEVMGTVADEFGKLPAPMRTMVVQGLALLAVLGPVLLILGKLIGGLGTLFGVFAKLTGSGGIGSATSSLGGFMKVAGKVAPVLLLVDTLLKIPAVFEAVGEAIDGFAENAPQKIIDAVRVINDSIPGIFNPLHDATDAALDAIEADLTQGTTAAGNAMNEGWAAAWLRAGEVLAGGRGTVTAGAEEMVGGLPGAVDDAIDLAEAEARKAPGEIASAMFESLEDIDAALEALTEETAKSVSDLTERGKIEAALASQAIRDGLSSESSKTRLDTLQLIEDLIADYELLAPGALGAGELVNPALIDGVMSNLNLADEVGDAFNERYGTEMDLTGIAGTRGYETTRAFSAGMASISALQSVGRASNAVVSATRGPLEGADSYTWGGDLVSHFASGMWARIQEVIAAANAVATAASGPLEFESPPKEGPLREIMTWGARLPVTFAEGMLSMLGAVGSAASALAGSAAGSLSNIALGGPSMAGVGALAGGGTMIGAVGRQAPEVHYHYDIAIEGRAFGLESREDLIRILQSLSPLSDREVKG